MCRGVLRDVPGLLLIASIFIRSHGIILGPGYGK